MDGTLCVRFWGVRGSVPSPGPETVRYGGNTSCVSLHPGGDQVLVFDAGTGIRALGDALMADESRLFLLLSHGHWDHIQGFPFFAPIYRPGREIYMFPSVQGDEILCALMEQMDGAHFPVRPEELPSSPLCVTEAPTPFLARYGLALSRIPTNHPGNGFGYRFEQDGRTVVYLTDNELDPPYAKTTEFEAFADFCRGADLLIHDAQYLERDMPAKHGWGHSLVSQACRLAAAARVKHLVLTHHDPDRSDDELDAIGDEARAWLRANAPGVACSVAAEGLEIRLQGSGA